MGKKAPDPTPPKETSAAATGTGVSTAIANSILNNPNEVGPDGTKTTTTNGYQSITDPYTNQTYQIPNRTVTTSLSPQQQAIKAQQDAAKLNLSSLGNQQSGFLQDYMSKPFSYNTGQHESWASGLFDKVNGGRESQARTGLQSQLSNQGIKLGSKAYNDAFGQLSDQQGQTRNRFLLDSYGQGFQSAQASRNQPINEITALLSGGQVSQPNFTTGFQGTNIPTTDNAGVIGQYDQARAQQAQANNAGWGSLLGGLGGLFHLSDERTKKDIKKIGETDTGLGVFNYRYKGEHKSAPIRMGLLAQEVEKKNPQAVVTRSDGYKMVDYAKALGVE